MIDAEFVARMIADMEAAECLPESMAFVVPPWWIDHPDLLAHLQAMAAAGQAVAVAQDIRLEQVPLSEWMAGLRRRGPYNLARSSE